MRRLITLVESVCKTPFGIVQKNLTPRQLLAFLCNSPSKELRGYIDDTGIYFWDAEKATHDAIAKALGLNYDYMNRLYIFFDPTNKLPEVSWYEDHPGQNTNILRFIDSDEMDHLARS